MNAMLTKRQWPLSGLLLLCILISTPLQALEHGELMERARMCTEESSRLDRLNCYDAIFKNSGLSDDNANLPGVWHAIERQESERSDESMGLMVQSEGEEVLISVPAMGTIPPRPVLVMACENLITRFQLHMPTPLSGARVEMQLAGNDRVVKQQWRVRDGGRVVSGGRGLPAIDTLRQLLDAHEVTLSSEAPALDGLRFDVAGLRQQIQPLRAACRW